MRFVSFLFPSGKTPKRMLTLFFELVIALASTLFVTSYLNITPIYLGVVLLPLIFLCLEYLIRKDRLLRGNTAILIFTFFLSAAVILGKHLHIEDPMFGQIIHNYILPYTLKDAAAFVFISVCAYALLGCLHVFLSERETLFPRVSPPARKWSAGEFFLIMSALFLMWLPYLLAYWPGFVFYDTENSFLQALNLLPLNNRNPILYTLFIRLCIILGGGFKSGDLTSACAIYSVSQMLYISACLSYMLCFIGRHIKINRKWIYLLAAFYGLSPYIAASSIAMWKDPVFNASLVLYFVLLLELLLPTTSDAAKKKLTVGCFVLSLLLVFWRNNGFSAVLFPAFFLFVTAVRHRKDSSRARPALKLCALLGAVLVIWGTVTIPVYGFLGIGTPKEESGGIMLNQMARAVACDGKLSDEDKVFLDSLIPLDRYERLYRPCCVDQLKWSGDFNYAALVGSGFQKTWLSVGLKNPLIYFEAWEMETCGFWGINVEAVTRYSKNISSGGLMDDNNGVINIDEYVIRPSNLLGSDSLKNCFPKDVWSVPLGMINWLMAFLCVSLILRKKAHLALALTPLLGVAMGLIIGTPIYYLPRYGAASQYLLPVLLLLLFAGKGESPENL